MRIIQIIPEFGLGGAEIMCENLIYELLKAGHDVIVISMFNYHSAITERLEKAGVDIRYLEKKVGFDLSIIWKMKKIFKDNHVDVIHTHLYCAQYAIPAAVLARIKRRIHTVHNMAQKENGKYARKLNKFFFKYCHVIPVALSDLVRDSIVREYKIKKEKIPIILNGIDLSKCIIKQNYSVDGTFKIIHIGSFKEAKNHVGLIEAFDQFHREHSNSELHLIGDGERRPYIEKMISSKNLINSIIFHGSQSNVYAFLKDMDIFTLPSLYEGIPITIIEAMGTGLPIVATTVGGIPDMLDEKSALLVPVEINAIAKAFEKYYCDVSLRRAHGLAALEASEKFSARTMAQKYFEIY